VIRSFWRRRARRAEALLARARTELAGAEVLAVVLRQQLADTRVELGAQRAISEELGERADRAEARLRAVLHPEAQA